VLDLQARVQSPDVYPAVVVYDRPSGITAADWAKAAQDIARFGSIQGAVKSEIAGPIVASDGRAIQSIVPVDLKDGWDKAVPAADSLRHIARAGSDGMAVHITGPLGNVADSSEGVRRD
jgi:putative drug exporter of the RND superfamily